MMSGFDFDARREGDVAELSLSGELDMEATFKLEPEIDRLLDEGRSETDADAREELYVELNKRFGSEVYNVWGSWTTWAVAHKPNVHGIQGPTLPAGSNFPGLGTGHYVHGIWVDQ